MGQFSDKAPQTAHFLFYSKVDKKQKRPQTKA